MFGHRYFGARYFGGHYFGPRAVHVIVEAVAVAAATGRTELAAVATRLALGAQSGPAGVRAVSGGLAIAATHHERD